MTDSQKTGTDKNSTDKTYDKLIAKVKEASLLASCSNVLGWEEHTYMPINGSEHRANQLGLLAGLCHEKATDPELGNLLSELENSGELNEPDSPKAVNVREIRHEYDQGTKLSRKLVEEISRVCSLGQHAWIEARKKSDFSIFLPLLKQIVDLKIEVAEALGYGDGVPYDALLDAYEPGATTESINTIFTPLREELVKLVAAIKNSGIEPDSEIITRSYPIEMQKTFGIKAAKEIGFCFKSGRLDETTHPFCSGIGPGDCRITTRYDEHHFPGAFFGILHEAGHGIYEQGLNCEAYGSPMGETVSLGIHESQSRMWENLVGRSLSFWKHYFPQAQKTFPEALTGVELQQFYAAINDVRPSFIRVEADEVTYNLHIMLRFELEQKLISRDVKPEDIPEIWNQTFTEYFGLTPPDDTQGCLQDIHWSMGGIGYFPTYTLGNMYASQFFETANEELGDLNLMFEKGEFQPLKNWLNEKIHQPGKKYRANDLVKNVTGKPLSHEPLVRHLHKKFDELYQL